MMKYSSIVAWNPWNTIDPLKYNNVSNRALQALKKYSYENIKKYV